MQNVVPKTSGIAGRSFVPQQNAVELIFNPLGGSIHDVEMRAGCGVGPFIPRLPEAIVNFSGLAQERSPEVHRYVAQGIDVKIEIRLRVMSATAARSSKRYRYDLGQFAKALYQAMHQ